MYMIYVYVGEEEEEEEGGGGGVYIYIYLCKENEDSIERFFGRSLIIEKRPSE